jgi:hypothetical protein
VSATLVPHESAAHVPEPAADDAAVRAQKQAPAADPAHGSAPAVFEPAPESPTADQGPSAQAVAEPRGPGPQTPATEQSPTAEALESPGSEPVEDTVSPRSGWLSRLVGR